MIEFYKLSNRFPFNIKIKDEKCWLIEYS
jgi:hypothetical protein